MVVFVSLGTVESEGNMGGFSCKHLALVNVLWRVSHLGHEHQFRCQLIGGCLGVEACCFHGLEV